MEFSNSTRVSNFSKEVFGLDQGLDSLIIYEASEQTHCYIADKNNGNVIYNDFILFNGPQVVFKCTINLSKNEGVKKYIPRITFYKENKKGEIKESKKDTRVRIEFTKREKGLTNFWNLISFLKSYKDLVDTGDFDDKYSVVDNSAYILSFNSKEEYEKVEELKKLDISSETLKKYLTDERKEILDEFRKLLENDEYYKIYENKHKENIKGTGEEAVFHYFLKKNDWILGLNVDIKFIKDFTDEVHVGNPDTTGVGNPKTDMMAISDYTTLIEFKIPKTHFFTEIKSSKSRTGTWSFTNDFIEGISQCLKQCSSWDKEHKSKDLVGNDKEIFLQDYHRTIDPKVIFIIGNKQKELNIKNKKTDNLLKRDTLERFRRNNRNVEIVSYDELYERAYFIVHNKVASNLDFNSVDDIPF